MGAVDLLLKDDTLKRHFAALPPIHQAAVNWQLERANALSPTRLKLLSY